MIITFKGTPLPPAYDERFKEIENVVSENSKGFSNDKVMDEIQKLGARHQFNECSVYFDGCLLESKEFPVHEIQVGTIRSKSNPRCVIETMIILRNHN